MLDMSKRSSERLLNAINLRPIQGNSQDESQLLQYVENESQRNVLQDLDKELGEITSIKNSEQSDILDEIIDVSASCIRAESDIKFPNYPGSTVVNQNTIQRSRGPQQMSIVK